MPQPEFQPFGPDHLAVLGFLSALAAALAALGRAARPRVRRSIGQGLGFVIIAYAGVAYAQKGLAGELAWEYALPCELCHWVMAAAAFALFRPSQLASEVAYFWGLAGTLQATLTPEIGRGFPSWEFVLFFWGHGSILLAIVFLVAQGFRPRPGSTRRMLVAVNLYALAIGTIDLAFGWNYGYLRGKPANPSLLDYLGPWPWYLASLELVALSSFHVLALPWRLRSLSSSRATGL